MYPKSSKYSPKYSGPKFAHHLNLSSGFQNWFIIVKTMILIVLYHFKIDLFQLGTDLNDGQFLGNCIFDLETLSEICFSSSQLNWLLWVAIRIMQYKWGFLTLIEYYLPLKQDNAYIDIAAMRYSMRLKHYMYVDRSHMFISFKMVIKVVRKLFLSSLDSEITVSL